MANTLTGLIQSIYDVVDVVSRELCGFIPSVYKNSKAEQVAKGQDITYPIVPAATATDITASNALPALSDTSYENDTMAISKVRGVRFHWTGDDQLSLESGTKEALQNNKFSQAFRTLANEMEGDLGGLYTKASRAYGTAGSTPFATAGDFTDASEIARILKDNGAPLSQLRLVINTAAGAKIIGKQSQVHMVGSADPLRQGLLLDVAGMQIRESAQVKNHTKGTGASYAVNLLAGYASSSTGIAVDTGSGTILAGDILANTTSGRDDNKYVVNTALSAGSLAINKPGLVNAWVDNDTLAVGNSYAANMAFSADAIHLLTRLPKRPEEGDQADDVIVVQDPVSGIFFEIAQYKAYRAVIYEVSVAWGVKAAKSAHMALLLG